MKPSNYNMIWNTDNGNKIAFNSMSSALAEIDQEFLYILDNIKSIDISGLDEKRKKLINDMAEGGYIIPKEFDELKLIEYRHDQGKYLNYGIGLTIAPTLACNFRCPYCYESAKPGFMSKDVQDAIIEQINKSAKLGRIHINWYGGEPLLAEDIIMDMSQKILEICERNSAGYKASMVTNGYLLNDTNIKAFKQLKIEYFQITVDGPRHIHNKRRILKDGTGSFDKILENMIKLKENNVRFSIRINIDNSNVAYLDEILDFLEENGLNRTPISLGYVTAYTEACKSISESCLRPEEYAQMNTKLFQIMIDRNEKFPLTLFYPLAKNNFCCAVQSHSYVVDPEGNLYRCWNEIGREDRSVGNIKNMDSSTNKTLQNKLEYMTWSPLKRKECVKCKYLPLCMGGCPYNGIKESKPSCERWKYNLEDILKLTYGIHSKPLDRMQEKSG